MFRLLIIFLFFQASGFASTESDLIFKAKVATSLSEVNVYPDSTFEVQSEGSFPAGALLEVIGETNKEYEDASQNQKFKWFKVRSLKGKEGWIFGDGLAVMLSESRLEEKAKKFHKKRFAFNNGFEKSVVWIGGIEGRDNFHKKDFLNPLYKEYYIVITNERGQCVFVNYSSENARGKMLARRVLLCDTTGDDIPELLLQTSSIDEGSKFENRTFEIFSFQSGNFVRILEERMSLSNKGNQHSPALFKHVEVDAQIVRIAYIDFLNCKDYSLSNDYHDFELEKGKCIEYVTYTYSWNERINQYKMIYKESRTSPIAVAARGAAAIKKIPSARERQFATARNQERLEIIKEHNTKVYEDRVFKTSPYFYVKLENGTFGYIKATDVKFIDLEHAQILNDYYSQPYPELKKEHKSKSFLSIIGDNRSSFVELSQTNG